jgi:nucleoside-diphosphate-sugar epimerase
MTKVLITGGAGSGGSNLVRRALAEDAARVTVVYNLPSAGRCRTTSARASRTSTGSARRSAPASGAAQSATVWRNVVPTLVSRALEGMPLRLDNGGQASRDFSYADACVDRHADRLATA